LTTFENRVSICKSYRGLRGEELKKISGIEEAEFVHAAGFIGGAWSQESALKMAEASLTENDIKFDTIKVENQILGKRSF
jgi:uncharacterized UPF0160 family protein